MADWWNDWYLLAGHRRLGRLLKARGGLRSRISAESGKGSAALGAVKAYTASSGVGCVFYGASVDSSAMFSVRTHGAQIRVVLNASHPAYACLKTVLQSTDNLLHDEASPETGSAVDGIRILLEAWARYEDGQPVGPRLSRAQDARRDWGRTARWLLDQEKQADR